MTGREPDTRAPGAQAAHADATTADRTVGLAFGKYAITAAQTSAAGQEASLDPGRETVPDLESARQAHGPQWPAWLSMTSIEPEPEIS